MGTLGVLTLARHQGILSGVKPIVRELIEKGFWISRKILEQVLEELGVPNEPAT